MQAPDMQPARHRGGDGRGKRAEHQPRKWNYSILERRGGFTLPGEGSAYGHSEQRAAWRAQARHERLTRSLPVAEGEVGEVTGARSGAEAGGAGEAPGEAPGEAGGPAPPAQGAPADGDRMYALPADIGAAAGADPGELRHLARSIQGCCDEACVPLVGLYWGGSCRCGLSASNLHTIAGGHDLHGI